jgi:hypothetical protein
MKMSSMRAVIATSLVVVTGCTTVRTGRDFVKSEKTAPQCGLPSYVVTASPLEYPKVLLDVIEERECNIEINETYVQHSEMHVNPMVFQGTAIALGALAGIGAGFALARGSPATFSPVPVASTNGSYATAYQGDAAIILPFVGALAGLGAYYVFGKGEQPVQTLPGDKEVETHIEDQHVHTSIVNGALRFKDGTSIGALKGGQAVVDLKVAQKGFRDGLWLDGHELEWSVRSGAWTPRLTAACARTQDAAEQDSGIERAPLGALARAQRDAAACAREGWAFASELSSWLDQVCRRRFDNSCQSATK